MNIAILLTGHFRGYKKVYRSFVDNILNPLKNHRVDIFIDTWNTLHTNNSYAYQCKNDISNTEYLLDVNDINLKYSPQKTRIDDWNDIKNFLKAKNFYPEDLLAQLEKDNNERIKNRTSEPITIKDGYSLIASQFYKFYSCNQLRKQYEKENNIKYDIIIKTRPDVIYFNPLNIETVDANFFYADHPYGDIFICGSGENIDIFCNAINNITNIIFNHITHPFNFDSEYHMYSCEFFEEWNLLDGGVSVGKRKYLDNFCTIYREK